MNLGRGLAAATAVEEAVVLVDEKRDEKNKPIVVIDIMIPSLAIFDRFT